MEDLCATIKTDALVTVFRRSITESKDQSHFDKAILPSMVKLMDSLLAKSGISPAGVGETHDAFETLLKQARRTYLLQKPEGQDFADRVSRFIVSRLSLAIGESAASTMTNANGAVPQPSVATSSSTTLGSKDTSVAQMFSKREIHMTAAKRYGVTVRSVCANFNSELGIPIGTNGGGRETEIATSEIMLALLGEDANATFELQKADLEELKAQAKQRESERAQELRTSIEELNEERETIGRRILELKQSIEKLETYDAELCVKVGDAQKELDEETAVASAEAHSLNEKIKEASNAIKYGNSVLEVVSTLKTYDDSLDKAIHTASKASFVPDAEYAHKQMEVYLSHVRDYFQSEANTIDFLRDRIVASRKAVEDLVSCLTFALACPTCSN